ncbi:MAG: hypothetical protein FDZ69_08620 [Deltaproteobacteria bacterium]|nr:MAG: hypothetical protein FDZ69_08620 [Deltaproteobacteria bacterium]
MPQPDVGSVRLKVSPQVARIVAPGAPRDVQLAAARGALPLSGADLLTALCFLCTSADAELKGEAVRTLRTLPATILLPVLDDPALHPRLIELLARVRISDVVLMERVIRHPAVSEGTLLHLAARAEQPVLERLADNQTRLTEAIVAAILANPHAERLLKFRLGWREEPEPADDEEAGETEVFPEAVDGNPDDIEEVSDEELEARLKEAEQKGMSKHQLALEMRVAEKIKMAMTGDKEWRNILVKDPNKLVHGAVLKNGRITEAEVAVVARNKTSSDELIRIILLNRDWLKNSDIRKSLVTHPKTPLPKAIRFIGSLTVDELKKLAKSRSVSTAIVTTARKELENRLKRSGG